MLTDDALIADITDRLTLLIHAIGMVVRAGGLPKSAVEALVDARIGIVNVLSRLNNALAEAEQGDNDTL